MDYNGSFKGLIVRAGYDVCGGNVFQSSKPVFGMNEYTPGSGANMFESALTWFKIRCIAQEFGTYTGRPTLQSTDLPHFTGHSHIEIAGE